ncbi:hypothetical protein [Oleiagrimonas sp. C23AA]|uniref:hypothetical protein n=1 Tax=Oleiagrimonas sp. C23AA TaxID=2719047 RepID=UPI00141FFAB4|nr:hypothetical protein [Oleiagrimonas sp. C23AA]NII11060.1 hypothetical protein [Oleiagrimonas sp. C23AA]
MKDLIFSELRRFRWLALAIFGIHVLALLFVNRISNLLQQSFAMSLGILLVYMAIGLIFAAIQVGSYRKPSQWIWLIHRPLAPSRIFGALALSALLMLGFVIFVPLLLLLLGTDAFTSRVVDVRHYLMIVHVLAFVMMAWMAGAHACVSRSRFAVAVLFAPLLLALHLVSTVVLLIPVLVALAWLTFITLKSFRANRDAPIHHHGTLLLTALPLQIGMFLLCVVIWKFLFVSGGILLGKNPLNTDFPPTGGLVATERAKPDEQIRLGLQSSQDPRAGSWRTQLPLLKPMDIGPALQRFPVRQQMSNLSLPTGWYDAKRNVRWTFSHDDMLFHGRNPQSGVDKGVFGRHGAGDTTPFQAVPLVAGGDVMTRHTLYGLDREAQTLTLRLTLRQDEQFTNVPQRKFNRILLLTNQRLMALREDSRAAATIKPLMADWQVPLPKGPQHLDFASVAKLMDGWLVSFVYDNGLRQVGFSQFNVVAQPWQQVDFIDADGKASVVATRRIKADFPALFRSDWWLSPPLDLLTTLPEVVLNKGFTWPVPLRVLPRTTSLYIAALAMALLSLALAWWWLRDTRVVRSRRALWLACCLLLGLPAMLSLLVLEPREPRS